MCAACVLLLLRAVLRLRTKVWRLCATSLGAAWLRQAALPATVRCLATVAARLATFVARCNLAWRLRGGRANELRLPGVVWRGAAWPCHIAALRKGCLALRGIRGVAVPNASFRGVTVPTAPSTLWFLLLARRELTIALRFAVVLIGRLPDRNDARLL